MEGWEQAASRSHAALVSWCRSYLTPYLAGLVFGATVAAGRLLGHLMGGAGDGGGVGSSTGGGGGDDRSALQLLPFHSVVLLCVVCGVAGAVADSVLGATLQFTGWDTRRKVVVARPGEGVVRVSGVGVLSNDAVNLLASTFAGGLGVAIVLMSDCMTGRE